MSVTMSVVSRTFFSHYFRAGTLVAHSQPSFMEDVLVSLSILKDVFSSSEMPVERPFLSAPGQVVLLPPAHTASAGNPGSFQLFILGVAALLLHSGFFSERCFFRSLVCQDTVS